MKKYFSFELEKVKKLQVYVLIATIAIQFFFLCFFSLIGKYDSSSTDLILKSYSGIIGLASTITMGIMVIPGTIVINKLIVANYIGDGKNRMFLYPDGREKIYVAKILAFIWGYSFRQLLGVFIANALYIIAECFFRLLDTTKSVLEYFGDFLIISMSSVILMTVIVLGSSVIGVLKQSTLVALISALCFITVLGNVIVVLAANYQIVMLFIAWGAFGGICGAIYFCGQYLKTDW